MDIFKFVQTKNITRSDIITQSDITRFGSDKVKCEKQQVAKVNHLIPSSQKFRKNLDVYFRQPLKLS